jgi:hypothetical protein
VLSRRPLGCLRLRRSRRSRHIHPPKSQHG